MRMLTWGQDTRETKVGGLRRFHPVPCGAFGCNRGPWESPYQGCVLPGIFRE